ncbi:MULTISPECIES: hypothetical protein [Bacillus cereus group]|uniref:hypothetical protein n=1 Tax=Bacillus cereus group TaxID=86661 RepID=UPI00077ACDF7|nr:hypothetical protein [Bacillus cereus]KXY95820.1 hypothetical protein AT279_01005 [Bacillus cereus]MDK7408541.1 hypothetical protein [Bacillus cereus]MDK7413949.1 hypothetical protein [Bacillus cereus]SMD91716.1 hypothetical protein BACERE00187_02113 [Bacillus cereus]
MVEFNKLEKAMIVGIILRALRSKKKIKQYVGLERLPNVIKVLNELQMITTFEGREEALISLLNKLLNALSEDDKGFDES